MPTVSDLSTARTDVCFKIHMSYFRFPQHLPIIPHLQNLVSLWRSQNKPPMPQQVNNKLNQGRRNKKYQLN
jgi:hypothetical protein